MCFGNGGEGSRFIWRWKRPLASEEEINELVDLCSLILQVNLNHSSDKWVWVGAEDGKEKVLTVKSARMVLDRINIQPGTFVPDRCKWIPKKCSVFIWRASMNKIATAEALSHRNIVIDRQDCGLCGEDTEKVDHLYTSCRFASMLWSWIESWCKYAPLVIFSFRDLIVCHNHVGLVGKSKEVLKGVIRVGCWVIWRARNEARFKDKEIKLEHIIGEVKRTGFLWYKNRNRGILTTWDDWCKFVNL
ncbi:putative reverse transcriptase zinc-binding domain-containing protein [Helianthus annuus]|nr:putative reverse transcriptase zinc-binding domain-containing protein [Helianthus annuus]